MSRANEPDSPVIHVLISSMLVAGGFGIGFWFKWFPAWAAVCAVIAFAVAGIIALREVNKLRNRHTADKTTLRQALADAQAEHERVRVELLHNVGHQLAPVWSKQVATAKSQMEVAVTELTARFSDIVARLNLTFMHRTARRKALSTACSSVVTRNSAKCYRRSNQRSPTSRRYSVAFGI